MALLTGSTGDIVCDLTDVTFMDSSGIRLFVQMQRSRDVGSAVVLRNPAPNVARVFELTGLTYFGIRMEPCSTVTDADDEDGDVIVRSPASVHEPSTRSRSSSADDHGVPRSEEISATGSSTQTRASHDAVRVEQQRVPLF